MADGTVHKLWGRVRDGEELTGQSQVEHGGRARFNRIYDEKTRKGYAPLHVEQAKTDTKTATSTLLRDTANASLAADPTDEVVATLVDRLVAANAHNLITATGGMVTVDTSGRARTALGIITAAADRTSACHRRRQRMASAGVEPQTAARTCSDALATEMTLVRTGLARAVPVASTPKRTTPVGRVGLLRDAISAGRREGTRSRTGQAPRGVCCA